MSHKVKIDNGKYEFILHDGWDLEVRRGGVPWIGGEGEQSLPGSKAIHAMMRELDAARLVVAAARETESDYDDGYRVSQALKLHDSLVGEGGKPSDWTKT